LAAELVLTPIAVDENAMLPALSSGCGLFCVHRRRSGLSASKLVAVLLLLLASLGFLGVHRCGFLLWLPFLLAWVITHQRSAHAADLLRARTFSVNQLRFRLVNLGHWNRTVLTACFSRWGSCLGQ